MATRLATRLLALATVFLGAQVLEIYHGETMSGEFMTHSLDPFGRGW